MPPFVLAIIGFVWGIIKGPIGKGVWHAICRAWSVLLVGICIWLVFAQVRSYAIIKKSTLAMKITVASNDGYKKGYSEATAKCPPAVTASGNATVNVNKIHTYGFDFGRCGVGGWCR